MNQDPTENYIKFEYTIKGTSGDLGVSVIADYLTHHELKCLESERIDYFDSKNKIKEEINKLIH